MTRVSGHVVCQTVAERYGMPVRALNGRNLKARYAVPRQVAMYLTRELCPHLSYPRIGKLMGGKHHTTVMHGVRATEARLAQDARLQKEIEALRFDIRCKTATHALRMSV